MIITIALLFLVAIFFVSAAFGWWAETQIAQLWTDRYAPQTLKEICGNKGQVEKLQQWLNDWFVPPSYNTPVFS